MKRFGLSFGLALLSGLAFAQTGIVGTKASNPVEVPATNGGTGVGVWALVQMLIALGIVAFLLKAVLPKIAGKMNGKFQSKTPGGIKLEETIQIPGGALHVVTVRGRTFFVGSTPTSIQHLAELTDTQSQPQLDPFEVALTEVSPYQPNQIQPDEAQAEATDPAAIEAAAQLERLSQLTGGHELH